MTTSAVDRAVAEYRKAHPEDDDLSDEVVASLSVVQYRVLGIAIQDVAESLGTEVRRVLSKFASR